MTLKTLAPAIFHFGLRSIAIYSIAYLTICLTSCGEDDKEIDLPECECSQNCTESCEGQLLQNLEISSGGVNRSYHVYLPPLYEISENIPVLFDLHGFTSNTTEQRKISDFISLAKEEKRVT